LFFESVTVRGIDVQTGNIGIQLASLRMPLKQALLTASQLGARGVEIDARNMLKPQELSRTGVRHLRKILDDLNLRVCAIGFQTRRGYDVLEQLEQRIDGTKRAMDMAFQLGAQVVVNHVGAVPAEPQGASWETMFQALADIGRHGQHTGVWLAAETGSEDGQRLKALIEALPSGALAVNFDPGNLVVNGHSPRDALGLLADHVRHVHATDGVRDLAQNRGLSTSLGRGTVDFPELIGALEEHQYRGYYTVEREPSANVVTEIAHAVRYLAAIMSG
jgi:sugar phosphate isomerase/epimerase